MERMIIRLPCEECKLSIAVFVELAKFKYPILCSNCREKVSSEYLRRYCESKGNYC